MAVATTIDTDFGEQRQLYIRLNNLEGVNNHAMPGQARFRAYLSRDAFMAGKSFVWERVVECTPDVSQPIWPQCYSALKSKLADPLDPLKSKRPVGAQITDV